MTGEEIEELVDGATDLLAGSVAMDPARASKAESLAFLDGVAFWVSSQREAIYEETRKRERR